VPLEQHAGRFVKLIDIAVRARRHHFSTSKNLLQHLIHKRASAVRRVDVGTKVIGSRLKTEWLDITAGNARYARESAKPFSSNFRRQR
jgi:hypothetical protein